MSYLYNFLNYKPLQHQNNPLFQTTGGSVTLDKINSDTIDNFRCGFLNAQWWFAREGEKERPFIRSWEIPFSQTPILYHYTDLAGLKGIVESRGVWASHIRYMNDFEEVLHGRRFAKKILQEVRTKTRHAAFSIVLDGCIQRLTNEVIPDKYIACFSRHGDSLDQWRGYCPAGGVSIELAHPPFFIMPVMGLYEALYDERAKAKFILLKIKRYSQEFLEDLKFYKDEIPHGWTEHYIDHIISDLEFLFPRFKNSAFRNEKEVRLLISGGHFNHFYEVSHRTSKNFIIPYVTTSRLIHRDQNGQDIAPNPLPITAITIGPSSHQQLTADSVHDFMMFHGYKEISIRLSKVPYRQL